MSHCFRWFIRSVFVMGIHSKKAVAWKNIMYNMAVWDMVEICITM